MKISVIMVDGGFRENVFSAEYLSNQSLPDSDYEIIWVEYFDRVHAKISELPKVRGVTLNRSGQYHSSFCFNKGIELARGELLVIPDADQIMDRDFLAALWHTHSAYERLVTYVYRYDEIEENSLSSFDFDELREKCHMRNPANYGGCLAVRKKWLLEINGYEMHPIFGSGFHANGLDLYTRFKNLGLAVQWEPNLQIFHPWHPSTLAPARERYEPQKKLIDWRRRNLQYMALEGIRADLNFTPPPGLARMLDREMALLEAAGG